MNSFFTTVRLLSLLWVVLLLPAQAQSKVLIESLEDKGDVVISVERENLEGFFSILHEKYGTSCKVPKDMLLTELNQQATAPNVADAVKKILAQFSFAMIEAKGGVPGSVQIFSEDSDDSSGEMFQVVNDVSESDSSAVIDESYETGFNEEADLSTGVDLNLEADLNDDDFTPVALSQAELAKAKKKHFMMQQRVRQGSSRMNERAVPKGQRGSSRGWQNLR